MLPPRLAAQSEKREPVPRRASSFPHGGTQGAVEVTVILEALLPNTHDDVLASVAPHQIASGHREPRVLGRRNAAFDDAAFVQFRFQEVLGCPNSKVGVVGDLECSLSRALRETTLDVCLNTPGDTPEEELLVIRPAHFPEDLPVLFLELASSHVTQRFDLFPKAC